jgi:hypothetical protein
MKEFTDLLKKKAAEQADAPKSSHEMEAKASAIKSLMASLKDHMGGELKDGLKKVTVASNSPEGLEKGLDLAKKVVPTGMDHSAPTPKGVEELMHENDDEEMDESPEMEASEDESAENGSDEERKIAELEKQLMELKAKKMA